MLLFRLVEFQGQSDAIELALALEDIVHDYLFNCWPLLRLFGEAFLDYAFKLFAHGDWDRVLVIEDLLLQLVHVVGVVRELQSAKLVQDNADCINV